MSNENLDLSTVFAMYNLRLLSPSDVVLWASSALREPVDESLLELSICNEGDFVGIERAASVLFDKHGLSGLTEKDILKIYALYIGRRIVSGELSPRNGADLIASATERYQIADFHDLDGFKYASSEMQDRPEDKGFFEQAIMTEAKALVGAADK